MIIIESKLKKGDYLMSKDLIEILADLEHNRWAHWQKYLHSCCIKNKDGSLTIPKEKVLRWENQIKTKYDALSEKDSDRRQAKKTIETLKKFYKQSKPLGIIVAGFGAIGKTYLGENYPNVIDMESGNFAHINDNVANVPMEKRKGTEMRKKIQNGLIITIKQLRMHANIMI